VIIAEQIIVSELRLTSGRNHLENAETVIFIIILTEIRTKTV